MLVANTIEQDMQTIEKTTSMLTDHQLHSVLHSESQTSIIVHTASIKKEDNEETGPPLKTLVKANLIEGFCKFNRHEQPKAGKIKKIQVLKSKPKHSNIE